MIGIPLYDKEECAQYLEIKILKLEGFGLYETKYYFYIWEEIPKSHYPKKKKKKKRKKHKEKLIQMHY